MCKGLLPTQVYQPEITLLMARLQDDPIADVFAVKTYYTPDASRYYETEVDAFRKLKRSQPHNPHLIAFFGNYTHSGTYNIILEYADRGSLEQYLQTEPPFSSEEISKVWESLFGILKALESIHQVELAKPNTGPGILNGFVTMFQKQSFY